MTSASTNGFQVRGYMDLHTQVSPLVAGGWLEAIEKGPLNRSWKVTPAVATQFEQRRIAENERKNLVAELIGSPRKPTGG
jgi:hypothetical protein